MFLESDSRTNRSGLFRQLLIASAATIIVSMALLSYLISRQLESSLTQTAAEEGALVVDILLGPSLQELATSKSLSQRQTEKLDELLKATLSDRTRAVKIWLRDATLIYATDKRLVGQKFPSLELDAAFSGSAFGSLTNLGKEENQTERHLKSPIVEIYAPIYRSGTREIIAVGEIYNSGIRLQSELKSFRWAAVAVVGAVTGPMMMALLLLVWRANAVVTNQRRELQKRVTEATALSVQNIELRKISDALKEDVFQSNERLLSEIGQDLHDGPVQLVSILALKLSELHDKYDSGRVADTSVDALKANVEDLTATILRELRDISVGLVLPELDGLSIIETLNIAIDHHEKITGTTVRRAIGRISHQSSTAVRVCVFRVVQQGLSNAYIHGNGEEQRLFAEETDERFTITIANRVLSSHENKTRVGGLGLPGLRRRVEALGGSLIIQRTSETMRVKVTFPLRSSTILL